ncbi:DUF4192 family protein [Arthrobacter bambusae]|uniref:DUF4192 domain-containing protein n=1 Tax=Arthrobacter bambusae TaxID=1338426 RepID=A0AAW8D4U3_9MICC|nr:DUF4192 family protein [Arthrobacter bambusae]MDP9903142.1 hypothetical protein [Arthrobacter bambusae]MDQ0128864.1 hypothetical protein [Arthrobacter bambusae]MDQ0180205.1 hypothetical protein [Arthrobacter bambusae]
MTQPEVITVNANSPSQLVSLIPALVGHPPHESMIIVAFQRRRSVTALRVDIPSAGEEPTVAREALRVMADIPGVDALALVLYTDKKEAQAQPISDALVAVATESSIQINETLLVINNTVGRIGDPAGKFVPVAPAPEDLFDQLVADGQANSTAQLLPDVDNDEKIRVAAAIDYIAERELDLRVLVSRFEKVLQGTVLEDAVPRNGKPTNTRAAAAMIKALNLPALRDVALIQCASSEALGWHALRAQLAFNEHGTPMPEYLTQIITGEARRPDAARLKHGLNAVRYLAAVAPESSKPGPFGAAAWLSWAMGSNAQAGAYAALALEINPGHALAATVKAFSDSARLPQWSHAD